MRRFSSVALCVLGALVSFALLARSAPADPAGVVVGIVNDSLIVTVNTAAANVHFTYSTGCANNKPCYMIDVGQGASGVTASARSCTVAGNQYTPTVIQCPPSGFQSIQFKLLNGGTWSAYAGGGGQHIGGPCSPASVTIVTGSGMNSVNTWDGCRETIYCDTGASGFAGVEVDAMDTVRGHCNSVVKH